MALQSLDKAIVVVTGARGFVGERMCASLTAAGAVVRAFDLPHCDLTDVVSLDHAVKGADAVVRAAGKHLYLGQLLPLRLLQQQQMVWREQVHLASYGMSGMEMMDAVRTRAVNVAGTASLIAASKRHGVRALVYTSTYNVVFGGQRVVDGDERLAYWPLELHPDEYSRSKSEAEQLVLSVAGSDGEGCNATGPAPLHCCALRAAAIWGAGERRHFPRIVGLMDQGLFLFSIGRESNRCDWVHVKNLVAAHMLALRSLLAGDGRASGKAFFINDGRPVNNWDFLRPIAEDVAGVRFPPPLNLPLPLAYGLAHGLELAHRAAHLLCGLRIAPLLSRAEALKVGQSHTFVPDRACKELGYDPTLHGGEDDMREMVHDLKQRFPRRKGLWPAVAWRWWLLVGLGLWLLQHCAFDRWPRVGSQAAAPLQPACSVGLLVFGSQDTLQWVWLLAWAIHSAEAVVAAAVAAREGLPVASVAGWSLRTLLLGGFALMPLCKLLYSPENEHEGERTSTPAKKGS